MTAPIVYADTRRPYDPRHRDETAPYLADADRRTIKKWPAPAGQLWLRIGSLPSGSRTATELLSMTPAEVNALEDRALDEFGAASPSSVPERSSE